MPKYHFEGTVIRNYYRLEPSRYYSITFTPPSFLKSGNYLVVLSHHRKTISSDIESFHTYVHATVSFQRSQSPETKSLGSTAGSKRDRVGNRATPAKGSLFDFTSLDHIQLLVNSIDSVTTLCALCSTSRTLRDKCDWLLSKVEFPSDLEYPGHATILMKAPANGDDVSKLSTDTVCRLAHIDVALQKLEFKLLSIDGAQPNSKFDTYLNYKSHLIAHSKEIPRHLSIWSHPNLYYQIGTDLVNRFNSVTNSFDHFFFHIKYVSARQITEAVTLEELEKKVRYLTDLPKTSEFKRQLTSEILAECIGYYVWALISFPFSCYNFRAEYNKNRDLVGTTDKMVIKPARVAIAALLEVWEW
ncbi:hypothetical protein BKA69DRAFT_1171328 [Paraphysoderma sedebokerense]|nr:hypothetical protein BKA69DRAFT_1171328 [Paraphysoderma sedebokerense]